MHSVAKTDALVEHIRQCEKISDKELELFLNEHEKIKRRKRPANSITSTTDASSSMTSFVDRKMSSSEKKDLDRNLLLFFATGGIPFAAVDNPYFIKFLQLLRPSYSMPSRNTLGGSLLYEEHQKVHTSILKKVEQSEVNSIVLDGWTDATGKSIFAVVVETDDGSCELLSTFDASASSHTAEFISDEIKKACEIVGLKKISAVVSDNASNMKKGRSIFTKKDGCKHILDVRCFMHAFGLTMGSVMGHDEIKLLVTETQQLVTFFRNSHLPKEKLESYNKAIGVKTVLKSSNATRLTSSVRCLESVQKSANGLRHVVEQFPQVVCNSTVTKLIKDPNYWVKLDNVIRLLVPFAKCIMGIQGNASTVADVARYWVYLTRATRNVVKSNIFTEEVNRHIIFAFNKRTDEIPTMLSVTALFLDPRYRDSVKIRPTDPNGNNNFHKICTFAAEIMFARGCTLADMRTLVSQIKAYSAWTEPYNLIPYGGSSFSTRLWWKKLPRNDCFQLQTLSIMLHSIKPHAAGPERTFSLFDWIQSKRRNKLHIEKVHQITAIKLHYKPPVSKTTKDVQTDGPVPFSSQSAPVQHEIIEENNNSVETIEDGEQYEEQMTYEALSDTLEETFIIDTEQNSNPTESESSFCFVDNDGFRCISLLNYEHFVFNESYQTNNILEQQGGLTVLEIADRASTDPVDVADFITACLGTSDV
jgi:hypothetical protein